jgi:hypothetical protein
MSRSSIRTLGAFFELAGRQIAGHFSTFNSTRILSGLLFWVARPDCLVGAGGVTLSCTSGLLSEVVTGLKITVLFLVKFLDHTHQLEFPLFGEQSIIPLPTDPVCEVFKEVLEYSPA